MGEMIGGNFPLFVIEEFCHAQLFCHLITILCSSICA